MTIGRKNIVKNSVTTNESALIAKLEPSFKSSLFRARKVFSAKVSIPMIVK